MRSKGDLKPNILGKHIELIGLVPLGHKKSKVIRQISDDLPNKTTAVEIKRSGFGLWVLIFDVIGNSKVLLGLLDELISKYTSLEVSMRTD